MFATVRVIISVFSFLLLYLPTATAQREAVDSLFQNLSRYPSHDTARVYTLVRLAYAYSQIDPDSTAYYARRAQNLAERLQYLSGIAASQQVLGVSFAIQGDYAKAQEAYIRSLNLFELLEDSARIAQNLSNLAGILYYQKDYNRSEAYLNRALDIAMRKGKLASQADTRLALAMVYQERGEFEQAEGEFRKMLPIYTKLNNRSRLVTTLNELALNLIHQGKKREALATLSRSEQISREEENLRDLAHTLTYIGDLRIDLQELKKARTNLQESLTLAEEMNLLEVQISIYEDLAILDSMEEDYLAAYQNLQQSYSLKEKISSAETNQTLAEMRIKYEVEQKDQRIEALMNQQSERKGWLEGNQGFTALEMTLILLIITSMIGLVVWAIFFFQREKQKRKAYKLMDLERKKMESQQEELTTLNQTKDQWFAMLCHDFKLPLTFLQGALALLNEGRVSDSERKMLLQEMENRVRNNTILLDNLLYWAQDQQQGIVVRKERLNVHQLIRDQLILLSPDAERHGVYVHNQVSEDAAVWADQYMFQLVLKNMLNNAIGMTPEGEQVTITSEQNNKQLIVHIADGGAIIPTQYLDKLFTFDHRRVIEGFARERGLGISLLISRDFVEKNGGEMWVSSRENGNIFSIGLPLAPTKKGKPTPTNLPVGTPS